MKGWGPKSSACPSKPRETKFLGGISRDLCRDIPGAPERFVKLRKQKNYVQSFQHSSENQAQTPPTLCSFSGSWGRKHESNILGCHHPLNLIWNTMPQMVARDIVWFCGGDIVLVKLRRPLGRSTRAFPAPNLLNATAASKYPRAGFNMRECRAAYTSPFGHARFSAL